MKTKLFLLTSMLLISTCLFNLFIKIVVSDPNATINFDSVYDSSSSSSKWNPMNNYTDEHLFWFIQISDLHISEFHDQTRIEEFKAFCKRELSVIRPRVVILTGDITDGKTSNSLGSKQIESEWKTYNSIVNEFNSKESMIWLDVRGNHDNFDVPSIESSKNYFKKYGFIGSKYSRSYIFEINDGDDRYSFICVDASLQPGPRRPFNFYGYLSEADIEQLEYFNKLSQKSNGTIWFGHFPTSTILSHKHLVDCMTNGIAYLSGHLHTLMGLSKQMYTRHSNGLLELELADWKKNRKFRIGVFDTGVFTMRDLKPNTNGIYIVVTNPKNFLLKTQREPSIQALKYSTHIRILVFSESLIDRVSIFIDNKYAGNAYKANRTKNAPLYLLNWNPAEYLTGIHILKVEVTTSNELVKETSEIEFTLDDLTTKKFGILSTWILKTKMNRLTRNVYLVEISLFILFLTFFRYYPKRITINFIKHEAFRDFILRFIRQMILVSSYTYTYWFLIASPIYVLIGPWFVGEIIEHYYGVCFAWGIYVKSSLLKSDVQYIYACLYIIQFHIPLALHFGYLLDQRNIELKQNTINKSQSILCFAWSFVNLTIIVAFFLFYTYESLICYSLVSVIVSPLRTWMFLLAAALHFKCKRLDSVTIDKILDSKVTIRFSVIEPQSSSEIENDKLK